jgi:hypothetical protein
MCLERNFGSACERPVDKPATCHCSVPESVQVVLRRIQILSFDPPWREQNIARLATLRGPRAREECSGCLVTCARASPSSSKHAGESRAIEEERTNEEFPGRRGYLSERGDHTINVAKGVRNVISQDGAVLLDIEQGLCFSLNPMGARIWEMINDGSSLDKITDALEQEFRLPRTQLLRDISDFLKQLEQMRLVGEQSSPGERRGCFSRLLSRSRSR